MGESTVKKVVDMTGMWWPDADSAKLRQTADAWRAVAEALDGVTAAINRSAQTVIGGNSGPAIDAFHTFWNRYYNGGSGALPDTAKACRQLASACDQFADEIDKAIHKLEEEATIGGAALVGGTALAFFTAGIVATADSSPSSSPPSNRARTARDCSPPAFGPPPSRGAAATAVAPTASAMPLRAASSGGQRDDRHHPPPHRAARRWSPGSPPR
jgi:hypothetical protein